MTRKLLCLLLALLMLVSITTGCQSQVVPSESESESSVVESSKTEESESVEEKPTQAPPSGIPVIFKEDDPDLEWTYDTTPVTLSCFYNSMLGYEWQWGDDEVSQYIQERTGVTLEYEFAPDNDGNRLTLMLASGEQLPDFIFRLMGNSPIMTEIVQGGFALPINELMDEYAPKMWDMLYESEIAQCTAEDGNIYNLPTQYRTADVLLSDYDSGQNGCFGVRMDIVKDLGETYDSIKTTDQLIDFFQRFKEVWKTDYPEILYPIVLSIPEYASGNLFGMFGYCKLSNGIYYDQATDELKYWYETPEGLESLKFFNQLYLDGMLLPESFAIQDVQVEIDAGSVLMFASGNSWQCNPTLSVVGENVDGAYTGILGPISKSLDHTNVWPVSGHVATARPNYVITKDCTNPERAIKFIEYGLTEEGSLAVTMGVYGKHFEVLYTEDGVPYPAAIGNAAELSALGRAGELGIYAYDRLWYSFRSAYDVISEQAALVNATDEKLVEYNKAKATWSDVYEDDPPAHMASKVAVNANEDMNVIFNNIYTLSQTMLAQIIAADNEAEFNELYNKLLADTDNAGKATLLEWMLPQVKDVIA